MIRCEEQYLLAYSLAMNENWMATDKNVDASPLKKTSENEVPNDQKSLAQTKQTFILASTEEGNRMLSPEELTTISRPKMYTHLSYDYEKKHLIFDLPESGKIGNIQRVVVYWEGKEVFKPQYFENVIFQIQVVMSNWDYIAKRRPLPTETVSVKWDINDENAFPLTSLNEIAYMQEAKTVFYNAQIAPWFRMLAKDKQNNVPWSDQIVWGESLK